jgi:nucleotide-binding universal stress UspA family protein
MKTILVPTDFSEASNNSVNYAVELAKYFNAALVLVNASPIPAGSYESTAPIEMITALRQGSKDALVNCKKEIQKKNENIHIDCYSESGDPYDVIVNASQEYHADLIVIGIIGGAGKIKEHIIGSTAVKVAQKSNIPVFIISETVKYKRIRKISFACDLENMEDVSVGYSVKYFSKVFDAELEIVTIEQPNEDITAEQAKNYLILEKNLAHVQHRSVSVTGTKIAKELKNYFLANPTDVVMLNPRKHSVFHNLFSESVTKELAFHLEFPILAVTNNL